MALRDPIQEFFNSFYMFQTSEGPSSPAHQFLFTGTSAPVKPNDQYGYYLDFVADAQQGTDYFGCQHAGPGMEWVYPNGTLTPDPLDSECWAHDTLVTAAADCQNGYCDRPGVTWGYYGPSGTALSIWDAPGANPQTCYGQASPPPAYPTACYNWPGTEYGDHVHLSGQNGYSDAPIFDDLYGCKLPMISYVIPDQQWSDHPYQSGKSSSLSLGPYWVGDIINAVGTACSGKYWSGSEPTAIFVVWDDWGGWYDHIPPWAYYRGTSTSCTGYAPNNWGCGYVSGFRVPFLVVSAWTGTQTQNGVTNYVSGACSPSTCPNYGQNNVYVHDFGSILAFTEWNFNFSPKTIDWADKGYADYNAPDWGPGGAGNPSNVPLMDFFGLSQPRQFGPISTTPYPYTCFTNWGNCPLQASYQPEDPDDY